MPKYPEAQLFEHAYNVPQVAAGTLRKFGADSYIPAEYTGWVDESMSWKETCYIGDWSPLWKLMVTGPDAVRFFSDISVNSFAKFDPGRGKHAIFCNADGKLTGDGVLMRLDENRLFFQGGPAVTWAQYMFGQKDYDATCESVGRDWFTFQVSGPTSLFALEKAIGKSLRDIGFMRFREVSIAGMPFYALRQGMAGEIGFELHGSSEHGRAVYQAILDAGEEFGIRRLGARAIQVNHVEACFPTSNVDYVPAMHGERDRGYFEALRKANYRMSREGVGNPGSFEIKGNSDLYRSPVEFGWGKSIKFDHNFVGREALEEEVKNPRQTIVTLVWNPDDVVDVFAAYFRKGELPPMMEIPRQPSEQGMWADSVLKDGELVGVTTSRCYSVYFREMLSLCTIDIAQAEPGTEVVVLWGKKGHGQKEIRATVAPAPYKQDKRKTDLASLPSYLNA